MGLRSLKDSTVSGEKRQFAVVVCSGSGGCGCGPRPSGEGLRKTGLLMVAGIQIRRPRGCA